MAHIADPRSSLGFQSSGRGCAGTHRRSRAGRAALAAAGAAALLTACAPPSIQMQPTELSTVRHAAPVYSTHVAKPTFLVMTMGRAAFGAFGAIAGLKAGQRWIVRYHVPNPSGLVENNLAAALQQRDQLNHVTAGAHGLKTDHVADLRATFGQRGLVLDVSRGSWQMLYYPLSPSHLKTMYVLRARLVDLASGKTLWQHVCKVETRHERTAPTVSELKARNGALLKQITSKMTQRCAVQLAASFGSAS